MTIKHTPGPWVVHDWKFNLTIDAEIGGIRQAFVSLGIPTDTRRANAKLIAAAPDLASALERTLVLAEKWADGVGASHPDHEIVAEASAALRKAGLLP